jgi:DNA-binding transcriptional MocR family regulator
MDLKQLEHRLEQHCIAAVLAVPSFSNPLGSCMPDEAKARLVRMLSARSIPLVEDDVYGDLAFGPSRPRPARAFDTDGTVMYCGSFSKTLAPGWRVGYVLPGRFRQEAQLHKFSLNVAAATVPQRALAHFLETEAYDRHLRRLRTALHLSSERIRDAVTSAFPAGTCVSRPAGGYAHWVELPRRVDGLELHERALAEGIAVVPGVLFGPRGGYERFVRISTGHPWEERLARGVQTLGRIATRLAEVRRAS